MDTRVHPVDGRLVTDLYVKLTDQNNLLLDNSNHLKKMISSLPWSKLLRAHRIVSQETVIDERLDDMCKKFLLRGYPQSVVTK